MNRLPLYKKNEKDEMEKVGSVIILDGNLIVTNQDIVLQLHRTYFVACDGQKSDLRAILQAVREKVGLDLPPYLYRIELEKTA
jgi:uridine kinase